MEVDVIPYTYLIGWSHLNKYYYGVRYANIDNPNEDLWKKYFTSSDIVKEFRIEHGEPDIISVDKIFSTKDEACAYELDFLIEHGCVKDDTWLNQAAWPVYDWTGRTHTEETKTKIANTAKSRIGELNSFYGKTHTEDAKRRISDKKKGVSIWETNQHPMKGKHHSEETLRKISSGGLGIKRSDETKAKIAEARRGKPRPKVTCPHCLKEGATGMMHRWHFDNCKLKT